MVTVFIFFFLIRGYNTLVYLNLLGKIGRFTENLKNKRTMKGSMDLKKITINSYNRSSKEYSKKVKDFFPKTQAKKFITLLPKKATILDAGCGDGRDAKIFSKKFKVIGVDLSSEMI